MKPLLTYTGERRPKNNISASDAEKLGIDIILSLNHIEQSNPTEWYGYLKMGAGKGVELEMLKILKENGIVDKNYDQDFEYKEVGTESDPFTEKVARDSTKIVRNGVTISMRFDAEVKAGGAVLKASDTVLPQSTDLVLGEGEPIEIKSINNKNSIDIAKYIAKQPRSNYVKQLAIYMDALGKEQGHLFVSSIDGLNTFWFVCKKTAEGIYQCGDTIVDLNEEYKRFAELTEASKNIWDYPKMKKYWNEETYKLPLDKIDWTKVSVSAIGEARNNRKVIGSENSFKINYSGYKDIIVRMQGAKLGYSEEEIAIIKTATAGYSAKPKVAKTTETPA
jgi:hypothetical protein